MMYGLGKKSLAKKVLLSVLAVGCISGYVMQPSALAANMSSISVDNGQIETIRDITVGHEADDISLTVASVYGGNLIAHNVEFIGRIDSAQGSRIELNYGSITTKDYAIIASDTDLNVNDVDIVGGIKIDSGSSMTMNGGSITGVKMIWDDGDPHDYTRVMSGHEGTVFTANDVKLDTNLFAQCGGKIIVNNSDVNAVEGLWVEGIDSNELPLDGATAVLELNGSDKSIYKYQRWVKVRGNANLRIIGGGTLERVSSEYIEGDPHPEIRVNRGARLDIESGEGTTNILDNLTIRDSSMYVSGKLNVLNRQDYTSGMIRFSGASQGIFGKYNADESVDTILGADAFINCEALEMYNATDDKSIVTLAAGSELNVNEYISVSGNSEFVSNGVTKAGYIRVYDGANVYINNGLVGTEEHLQANDPMMLAASAYGGQLTANNVDFIGGLVCENGGSITLAGGSVTSLKLVEDDGQPADEDDWSRVQVWGDGGIITANEVDLKTSLNAYDGGHIIVKNSNVDAMEGVWSQGKDGVSGAPTIVELYGSDTTTYKYKGYFKALDEGVLKILGGGTISRTGEEYSYMKAQNGAHLGIESGKGTTNIRSTLSIEDSTMHVSGKLNILPVDEIDRGTIYIAGQSEVLFGKYGTDAGNDPVESIVNENAFITCEGLVINDVVQDVEELSYKDYIDEKNSLIPLNGTSDKKTMVSLSNGSELAINKRISANGNVELIADGKVSAGALYSVNGATVNLNGGGVISGITRDSADVAAEIRDGSTLSATNIDFTGEIGIDNGSRVTLTGGSVTSGNQYLDEGKPTPEGRKTEIAVRGEGTVFTANGVTINSNLGVFNGGKMIINDSDINAEHAIYAGEGSNTSIILNGSKDNIYTVDQILAAKDGAKIYINGGKLKANNLYALMYEAKYEGETVTSDPKSIVLDKDGYIETMSDQIYANAASEYQRESGAIINEGIDFKGGTLVLNDAQYTLSYSETALAELQKQGGTKLTLTGTMVEESGEEQKDVKLVDIINDAGSAIEHDKINALVDGNLLVGSDTVVGNVEGIKIEQSVKNGFSVASIELKEGSSSVVITNGKDITLGGSEGGSVVTVAGEDANVKIVVGTTSSVVGASEKKGSLNIGNSFAKEDTQYKLQGDVVINRDSSLNTKGQVAITGDISVTHGNINVIKGSLNVQNINVKDNVNILGNVNIEKLQSLDNSGGVRVNVGNNEKSGQLTVQEIKLNGGTVFLDPAWQDGATISDASGLAVMNVNNGIDGKYVVGRNSLLSLGCTSEKAQALFANSEQNWGPQGITAAVCIADHIDVSNGSIVVDGSLVETSSLPSINNGKVVFGDDSLVIIDGSKVKGSQAAITNITAAEISNSSKLFIANVQRDTTYDVLDFAPGSSSVFWEHDNVILGSSMMRFASWNLNSFTTYAVSLTDQYGNDINAPNSFDQAGASGGVAEDFWNHASDATRSYDAQVSAFNSAAAMGELAGVEHGTFAVSNLFTDAVAEHMSLVGTKAHDKDIWAKYIHSKNKVDGLAVAGNYAKYDATYNGIVVGSDLYKQDKGVVGVALTYVDGNIKDNTLAARTENDATYYGLNIYGGIQNEDSVVVGDISYLHGKNDITQRNSGMNLTADAKSDAFSIGVHAEKAIKAGVGKFAPYAGLRYMHLGTGNYTNSIGIAYDGDDMNLWILPVGVKYSADIQKGVWNIRPVAEIGYVWNMGDRNAKQTVSLNGASDGFGFDVADSGSYVGRLAVEAERANVTYGLGYEYQKGDSVNNNKWTANVTWSF